MRTRVPPKYASTADSRFPRNFRQSLNEKSLSHVNLLDRAPRIVNLRSMGKRIFIALALLNCAGWENNPTRHYHLEIDPTFTDAQASAIVDAATQWQLQSKGYVTFDGDPRSGEDIISFVAATTATMEQDFGGGTIGMAEYHGQSSQIFLVQTMAGAAFHQTAEHEIGHAIGLVHSGEGTLMCQNAQCAALTITCGDITQLYGDKFSSCP